MASAVLANRNEGNWPTQPKGGGGGVGGGGGPKFMGKLPNPNPKKRQFHQASEINGCQIDESPAVTQSAASDDASSINRRPNDLVNNNGNHVISGNFISFNVASYSKKELIELKNRLVVELEQIRQLKNRIEGTQFRSGSKKSSLVANNKISGSKRTFSSDLKRLNHQDKGKLLKLCGQILTKLMKHKHGYIFNTPVDVVGMGLHDYHDIIKCPMDLGTVKAKLSKNLYDSPLDFAADVRLTFNNAMTYNPKGHDVYILAEQLLGRFEELFRSVNGKTMGQEEIQERLYDEELPANSWNHQEREVVVPRQQMVAKSDPMRVPPAVVSNVSNANSNANVNVPASTSQLPVRTPSPVRVAPAAKPLKQPKPKAKDPNKREMSMEEKHKLGLGLQSLPQEKMEHVVHILRKRNGNLRQDEDEIELDIEALDTETLWELDRFVTNYKKMVSKIKRQALMVNNNNVANTEAVRVSL